MNLPPGPFGTIVADPPWQFHGSGRLGMQAKRRPHISRFPSMTDTEIAELPVQEITAEKAHLYLWVTANKVEAGYDTARAWGFEPRLQLVWVKRHANGPLQIGMGRHFRRSHELCLFAIRGGLMTNRRNVPTVFEAPRPRYLG